MVGTLLLFLFHTIALKIIIECYDLFVGQIVFGHNGVISGHDGFDLFEGFLSDIGPGDRSADIVLLVGYDLFPFSVISMTGGTADTPGIVVEHLSILEIRDKITVGQKQKRK